MTAPMHSTRPTTASPLPPMNNRKRTALCLLGAALCVFMTFGAALALGRYPITPAALLAGDAMAVRTFTVLRLPRAVMALIGGFGLGAAGFVYQTVFRNPLASPDIIGVSSGGQCRRGVRHPVRIVRGAVHHGLCLCGRAGGGVPLAGAGRRRRGAAKCRWCWRASPSMRWPRRC